MHIKDFIRKNPLISVITVSILILLLVSAIITKFMFFSGKTNDISVVIDYHNVDIEPLTSDKTGVDIKSGFKIVTKKVYSEATIKSALSISPLQDYKLKKVSSTEYNMNFKSSLNPNSIYKISLGNKDGIKHSWAFQTKKMFRIERSLPRDTGTDVPLNSGIEITFSEENMDQLDNYFEISPKVEGRFEYHKNTAVFVPKGLMEDTVYTVTIKKGIGLKNSEDTIKEDYTFKFQTVLKDNTTDQNYFYMGDFVNNFTSDTLPVLQVYANESFVDSEFNVEIYKYPSDKEYLADLKKYDTLPYWAHTDNNRKFDTQKLTSVSSFNALLYNMTSSYWNAYILRFPSKLPEGHYLVNITSDNIVKQVMMQVNDDACYLMTGENNNLAWVNDSITGQPVENASVEVEGLDPVKTNKDGVAVLNGKMPHPKTGSNYYFRIVRDNKPVFVAPLNYYPYQNDNDKTECKYWSYMYLDRGLYLPTDTVKIWGVVKPRESSKIPQKATLSLYPSTYYGYTDTENEMNKISSKDVAFTSFGAYNSEMDFSNLSPGNYYMVLKLDNIEVCSQYFEVRQYTKPAYKLDVTSDKESMYSWDSANISVQASFFEGSPVTGLKINYGYNAGAGKDGTLKCDQSGSAKFTLKPAINTNTWHPYYADFNVSNAQAEEEEISAGGGLVVFPSDMMIELKTDNAGSKASVNVQTHAVDLSKFSVNDSWYSSDSYRGISIDKDLHANVYEDYWVAVEDGDYYDFINKTVEKKYTYNHEQRLVEGFDFKTSNGSYSFDFNTENDKFYKIEISGADSHNNNIIEEGYVGDSSYDPNSYDSGVKYYTVINTSKADKFKEGDTVSLDMNCNGKAVEESPNARSLYLRLKNGLLDYAVKDNTKYSFDYDSSFIPNIFVQGVYFDGKNIFNAGTNEILYDYDQKKLDITVTPDKKDYKPKDTVNLDISVKDPSGKPCSADVNLSVVDEALFAIQNQSVDTLGSLYQSSFYTGIISDFVSFKQIDMSGMNTAEMGEGGDQSLRYMFKDNGYFGSVRTDSNGNGKISFKLPDNLTSWRITYQGVTDDLLAGNGSVNVNSKQPFFIDVIMSNVFMEGDSPSITARSFGTALGKDDSIDYVVTLEGPNGYNKTFTDKGTGNGYSSTILGKLIEGDYSITIKASSGIYKDGIKKDFKVVKNILEAPRIKKFKLTEGLKPEGGSSLTTLTFYNNASSLYLNTLWDLFCQWGNRVDQKLSRKLSINLMKKYFPDEINWYGSDEDFNLQQYQCPDGGIALLPYDSSDPVLSAKICSLAKDSLDQSALKKYFYSIVNNQDSSSLNVAAAYWGLASLNEPVLVEIKDLLESPGLGVKEKIYLGIALAQIGDSSGAEEVYSNVTAKDLKHIDPYIYLYSGVNKDDIIDNTALLSVLALKTNAPEKNGLLTYVTHNSTKDILVNSEMMYFVTDSLPDMPKTGKFIMLVDGVSKDVSLVKDSTFQVTLTQDKLKSLSFKNISGDIEVSSSFTGPVTDLMTSGNSVISLKRTYMVGNKQTDTFNQSDLIKVVIHPEFTKESPDGYYEITDVLPSGLRYVPGNNDYNHNWYFNDADGQKISFWYNYGDKNQDVVYYARAVSPGEFTADYAIIKDTGSNASGFAPQQQIQITK